MRCAETMRSNTKIKGLFDASEGHFGDNKSWYSSGLSESSIVGFRILRQCNVIVSSDFEVLRQLFEHANLSGDSIGRWSFLLTTARLGYCCTSLHRHRHMALEILGQLKSRGSIASKKPTRVGGCSNDRTRRPQMAHSGLSRADQNCSVGLLLLFVICR